MGNVLLQVLPVERDELSRLDESILRQTVKKNSNHYRALFNLAIELESGGQLEEAADFYARVIELRPRNFRAHDGLGYVLALLGKHEASDRWFRESIRLNPKYAPAHHHWGMVK